MVCYVLNKSLDHLEQLWLDVFFFFMKRFFRYQQETTVAAGAKETVSTDFDESNRLYFEELLAVIFCGFFPWLILS